MRFFNSIQVDSVIKHTHLNSGESGELAKYVHLQEVCTFQIIISVTNY